MKTVKLLLTALAALLLGVVSVSAQSAEEIISRMEAQMSGHEKDGMAMTADTKIPILGTIKVRTYMLGDKVRMDTQMKGVKLATWEDGDTEWVYNAKNNEIEIKKATVSSTDDGGDAELFNGITEGYDVSIKKETDEAWYIQCRKSKANKQKEAPKSMDLVVAKGTFYPISLSAKVSGISMTMYDISFGVTEADVTFNINDFPNAKVVDKRFEKK